MFQILINGSDHALLAGSEKVYQPIYRFAVVNLGCSFIQGILQQQAGGQKNDAIGQVQFF